MRVAPDLKLRSGISQSNVARGVKHFQTKSRDDRCPEGSPIGGGHTIVVPDRSVPRLSPRSPQVGDFRQSSRHRQHVHPAKMTTLRKARLREGNASPRNKL